MANATKRILIVTHAPPGSTKGNRITAERWAMFLQQRGHQIHIASEFVGDDSVDEGYDALIALHATSASSSIASFQNAYPQRDVFLCLTGTDLHLDLQGHRGTNAQEKARESIHRCNRLVLLEPEGLKQLPDDAKHKVTVIVQSAIPQPHRAKANDDVFKICVVGHLRDEKDPFLAAHASLLLPPTSKISIAHFGAALNEQIARQAEREMQSCPRYAWIGALPHIETQTRLAASRAMILSSKIEGAPSVVSEAIVNHVPILSTRIPATIGLLGSNYPGMFPVGNETELSKLMIRIENELSFMQNLRDEVGKLAPKFAPNLECKAICDLLESAGDSQRS